MGCLFLKTENFSDETIKLLFSFIAYKDPKLRESVTAVLLQKNVPIVEQIVLEEIFSKTLGKYFFEDTFAQEIGYSELTSLNGISEEVFDEICGICNVTKIVSKEEFEMKFEEEREKLNYQRLNNKKL
jgi:hypothetical protein